VDGKVLLWWGLGGVILGVALPLLMVLDVIQPTFLLGFIAFAASVGGLFLGLYGSAMVVRSRKR
jgi:hypothetical protein